MNEQEQMIQQIQQLVAAAMQGDQKAQQQIQQIGQAAQQGDQQAAQIMQVIQQVAQQMQGGDQAQQPAMAKQGTKLEYIKSLKGECPEGYEMKYMKAGGSVCPVCQKKAKKAKKGEKGVQLDKCGGKANKTGAVSKAMEGIKIDIAKQKFQEGGGFDWKRLIPVYGTYLDIKDAVANPTAGNIGQAVVSGLGDVLTFGGLGMAAKAAVRGARYASTAARAANGAAKLDQMAVNAARAGNMNKAARLNAASARAAGNAEAYTMGANAAKNFATDAALIAPSQGIASKGVLRQ